MKPTPKVQTVHASDLHKRFFFSGTPLRRRVWSCYTIVSCFVFYSELHKFKNNLVIIDTEIDVVKSASYTRPNPWVRAPCAKSNLCNLRESFFGLMEHDEVGCLSHSISIVASPMSDNLADVGFTIRPSTWLISKRLLWSGSHKNTTHRLNTIERYCSFSDYWI